MRLRVHGLKIPFESDEDALWNVVAQKLNVDSSELSELELVKRSLDARKRPAWVCSVDVSISAPLKKLPNDVAHAPDPMAFARKIYRVKSDEKVVVIGAGPAGLFAANMLAESGVKPVVLERGQPVEIRAQHVSRLMHKGELLEDSNICFGEGGAGTWSDGKLYTRVNDPKCRQVLETIVELGGPERILVDGKPHLGTDRLVKLCKSFRARLTDLGAQVRFGETVVDFKTENDRIVGVELASGEVVPADRVLLCVGHSARGIYRLLKKRGVEMVRKPFAVGFRVEHKQAQINEIQYGDFSKIEGLPTADYKVTANFGSGESHVGVYSFCMCPGGQIVPSSSEANHVCINGMSHASRRGHYANSALVVTVSPDDFSSWAKQDDVLAGVEYQRRSEKIAYDIAGGGYLAPAQLLADFASGEVSQEVIKGTYKPGVAAADLSRCYPERVSEHLKRALLEFDRRMPGFLTNDAMLVGVETRTSSPVRVERGERFQSTTIGGLYPIGEGAGYGGGIVSAAVDGLRVAEAILEEMSD